MREANAMAARLEQQAECLGGIDVVVDHEDLEAARQEDRGSDRRFVRRRRERQAHRERRTLSGARTVHGDRSSVQVDEAPRERESDPEAALRAIDRLMELREHLEDRRQLVARDADTGVRDGDVHRGTVASRRHRDRSSAWRVFARVRQQIRDHLRDARRIRVECQHLVGDIDHELQAVRLDRRASRLQRAIDDGADICTRRDQRDLAERHARDVEQVVHHAHEVDELSIHHVENALALVIARRA
jgi:hypothetical protein